MNIIHVKELFATALSESSGIILRQHIQEFIKKSETIDALILDFDGISLFASPFFNASIGYLVWKYGPDFVKERIQLINISELGQKTFDRSYNNAKDKYISGFKNDEIIGKITEKNIQNS